MNIIQELENGNSNSTVCKQFNLKPSTVSTVWKNREIIKKLFEGKNVRLKRRQTCEKFELDKCLFEWFKVKRNSKQSSILNYFHKL